MIAILSNVHQSPSSHRIQRRVQSKVISCRIKRSKVPEKLRTSIGDDTLESDSINTSDNDAAESQPIGDHPSRSGTEDSSLTSLGSTPIRMFFTSHPCRKSTTSSFSKIAIVVDEPIMQLEDVNRLVESDEAETSEHEPLMDLSIASKNVGTARGVSSGEFPSGISERSPAHVYVESRGIVLGDDERDADHVSVSSTEWQTGDVGKLVDEISIPDVPSNEPGVLTSVEDPDASLRLSPNPKTLVDPPVFSRQDPETSDSMSVASSASSCESSETDDTDDARNDEPTSVIEQAFLRNALELTVDDFENVTNGRTPALASVEDNYFSQWAEYQSQLTAIWPELGHTNQPPILFGLDRWTGGILDWKTAQRAPNCRDCEREKDMEV